MRFYKDAEFHLRLFCFPFAGASTSVFRPWMNWLPKGIELAAVQLPGRESRVRERCISDMDELAEQLVSALAPALKRPFAFFGHSMGALIAYEVLRRLEQRGHAPAELFFACGSPAPHTRLAPARRRVLSKEEIVADLHQLGCVPAELLKNREILNLLLPMLQADFELYANYGWRNNGSLSCPIVSIRGEQDTYITAESQLGWKKHTNRQFTFHSMHGKHLFLLESPQAVVDLVNVYLSPILEECRIGAPEQACFVRDLDQHQGNAYENKRIS